MHLWEVIGGGETWVRVTLYATNNRSCVCVTNRKVSFMSFIYTWIDWKYLYTHIANSTVRFNIQPFDYILYIDYMHLRLETPFMFTENGFPTESQSWNLNCAIRFIDWNESVWVIMLHYLSLLWDHPQSTNIPFCLINSFIQIETTNECDWWL